MERKYNNRYNAPPVLKGRELEDALLKAKYIRHHIYPSKHLFPYLRGRLLGIGAGHLLVVASIVLLDKDRNVLGRMRQDGLYFRGFGSPDDYRRELIATDGGPRRSLGILLHENEPDFGNYVAAALAADEFGIPAGTNRRLSEVISILRSRREGAGNETGPQRGNQSLEGTSQTRPRASRQSAGRERHGIVNDGFERM